MGTTILSDIWRELKHLKAIADQDEFFSTEEGVYQWDIGFEVLQYLKSSTPMVESVADDDIEIFGIPVRVNYKHPEIIKLWKEVKI